MNNHLTSRRVTSRIREAGLAEISRALEEAIDLVKTKQGDARVILVGGGSIIIGKQIAGVGEIIRPKFLEVANAVGAAVTLPSNHHGLPLILHRSERYAAQ